MPRPVTFLHSSPSSERSQSRQSPSPLRCLAQRYQLLELVQRRPGQRTYLAEDLSRPSHPQCWVQHCSLPSKGSLASWQHQCDRLALCLETAGQHPQIPALLTDFVDEQGRYFVLDTVEGDSLATKLTADEWSETQTLSMIQDILNVLDFLHSHKIVHGHLTPKSLIHRAVDHRWVISTLTIAEGDILSPTTPQPLSDYAAPEQTQGQLLPSSDLYALGLMAIHCLTGLEPQDLQRDRHTQDILWPQNCSLSQPLRTFLNTLTAPVSQRYSQAMEALQALATISLTATQLDTANLSTIVPESLSVNEPSLPDPSLSPKAFMGQLDEDLESTAYLPDIPVIVDDSDSAPNRSWLAKGMVAGLISATALAVGISQIPSNGQVAGQMAQPGLSMAMDASPDADTSSSTRQSGSIPVRSSLPSMRLPTSPPSTSSLAIAPNPSESISTVADNTEPTPSEANPSDTANEQRATEPSETIHLSTDTSTDLTPDSTERRSPNSDQEPLYRWATRILITALGDNPSAIINSLQNLAQTYEESGNWVAAEFLHRQVFKLQKEHLGASHHQTLATQRHLTTIAQLEAEQDSSAIATTQPTQPIPSQILEDSPHASTPDASGDSDHHHATRPACDDVSSPPGTTGPAAVDCSSIDAADHHLYSPNSAIVADPDMATQDLVQSDETAPAADQTPVPEILANEDEALEIDDRMESQSDADVAIAPDTDQQSSQEALTSTWRPEISQTPETSVSDSILHQQSFDENENETENEAENETDSDDLFEPSVDPTPELTPDPTPDPTPELTEINSDVDAELLDSSLNSPSPEPPPVLGEEAQNNETQDPIQSPVLDSQESELESELSEPHSEIPSETSSVSDDSAIAPNSLVPEESLPNNDEFEQAIAPEPAADLVSADQVVSNIERQEPEIQPEPIPSQILAEHNHFQVLAEQETVQVIDTQTGSSLYTLSGHHQPMDSIEIEPAQQTLLIGISRDRTIYIWDLQTGQLLHTVASAG